MQYCTIAAEEGGVGLSDLRRKRETTGISVDSVELPSTNQIID